MKEAALVRKIMAAVRAKHPTAWVRKLSDGKTRGLPDLVIVTDFDLCLDGAGNYCQGRTIFVEVKLPDTGVVSPIQAHEAETVNKLGVPWIIATCVEDVLKWMT